MPALGFLLGSRLRFSKDFLELRVVFDWVSFFRGFDIRTNTGWVTGWGL